MKAPDTEAVLARLGRAMFRSPGAAAVSLLLTAALAWAAFALWRWGVRDAVFGADLAACQAARGQGACWGFVAEKHRLILFGRYPYDAQWRPLLASALLLAMLALSAWPRLWSRAGARWLAAGWLLALPAFFVLMAGGVFGLARIESAAWGGLPLTLVLTLIGMVGSAPLGVLLALGRRSSLGAVSMLCTLYIELVRSVPLITVLFVAAFVLPLMLPPQWQLDAFTRIACGIALFQAAYLAETVRGGLQTVPRGQYEAAASLGLGYWRSHASIILPQAFVAVVPALVNSLLSTFMDTALVTVVSLYDLTGALRLAFGDAQWNAFFIEGYLFVGAIYFFGCLALSRYSGWLERRLRAGVR